MQTDKAMAAFLVSRQAKNLRPKTLEYYRWCLARLARHQELPTDPIDLELILAEASGRLAPESLRDLWRGLRAYRSIFERAGLKGGPHSLRHTFATEYLKRGGNLFNLQRILGHADLATTRVYVNLVHSDLVQEHLRISPARDWFDSLEAAS